MKRMAVSRFFFSLKNSSSESQNLLKRFGPSKRFHSSTYMRSERRTNSRLVPETTQTSESSRSYILPAAVLAGFGGLAMFLHYNDERRAIPKEGRTVSELCASFFKEGSGQGEKWDKNSIKGPKIGGPFSLYDTQGRIVTEHDLMGKWVLLYFGYTSSPDVGPAEVQKMVKAIDALEKTQNLKVLPVFVTIDPQRDTPSQLSAYLNEFDPRIVGLTGPVPAIRQMAQEYRVFFKKVEEDGDDYLVESSHNMYLMNPSLEIARCFGVEYNAEEMAEAILAEIKKPGA